MPDADSKPVNLDVSFSTKGTPESTTATINGQQLANIKALSLYWNGDGHLHCSYTVVDQQTAGGFQSTRTYDLTKGEVGKADWDANYINNLPDSAFLYISSGGEKDEDGKTVPRTNRHFPVRNANDKLDPAHLRNAIGRIPQSNAPGLDDDKKKSLQDEARKLLEAAGVANKLAKAADLVMLRTVEPGIQDDIDAPLAAALAGHAAVIGSYIGDMPAELRDAVREIVKLATQTEAVEEVDVTGDTSMPDKDATNNSSVSSKELEEAIKSLPGKVQAAVDAAIAEREKAAKAEQAKTDQAKAERDKLVIEVAAAVAEKLRADGAGTKDKDEEVEVDDNYLETLAAEAVQELVAGQG